VEGGQDERASELVYKRTTARRGESISPSSSSEIEMDESVSASASQRRRQRATESALSSPRLSIAAN